MHERFSAETDGVAAMRVDELQLSFRDLRCLLERIRGNETLCREQEGKVFTTLLQQEGVKLYFNIEKKSKEQMRRDGNKKEDKVRAWVVHVSSIMGRLTKQIC